MGRACCSSDHSATPPRWALTTYRTLGPFLFPLCFKLSPHTWLLGFYFKPL